jgi:hypothetical protein
MAPQTESREAPTLTTEARTTGAAPTAGGKYSYSRRRQNTFDVWQEHVRRSAEIMSRTLFEVSDPVS